MRSKKRLTLIVLTIIAMIACLVGAVACGGGAEEDAINMYILPENETLVSDDFTLPKTIGAGGAIAVTWKSDNTNAIKIEDNGGAEYDAKVTLQAEVTPVKLTISAGGASKDFTVRVDALTVYTFLNNYSFPQEKTSVTKDFDLETSTTFAGHTAQISWSVVDNDSKQYLEVVGNKAHVKPDYDLVDVKIQATFTYGTDSANTSYTFSVSPEFEPLQKVNRMYSQADYPLEFSGYIVHAYEVSEGYGNATMYVISDTFDYGYYLYRAKINTADVDKYVEGAHVTFSGGTAKNYNGLWENNSNGTVLVDDKAPIDPRDHVYAMDTDLLADVPSLLWRESTLVSLSGWQVSEKAKEKPTAADSTLFTLKQGSKTIAVRISKYINRTEDQLNDLLAMYDSVEVGDYVDVTGILGYYNAFQIQPISASDIKKVDAAVTNSDGAKLKEAVKAVNEAVKGIGSLVAAQKTIDMPTEKEGVTISYKLVPASLSNPTVTINGGTITVDPTDSEKNYDIQVTYTLGNNNYYSFFKLRNWKKTAQEIVDIVADAAKKARIGNITASGNIDLPEIDTLGATIDWSVKGGAPSWLSISGSKLTVSTLPEFESTLTFIATVSLDGAQSESVELRAVKVSARPNVTFTALEEAKAGDFVLSFYQAKLGKQLYSTAAVNSSNYGLTTDDYTKAATFTLASTDKGWTIQVKSGNNVGKYLSLNEKHQIQFVDEATAWTWDATLKVFTLTLEADSKTYYLGTYNTFDTMSASETSYISGDKAANVGVTQFPAQFGTVAEGPKKTDQDLVNAAVADVLDSYKVTVAGDWLLPTCKVNGVTFTWEVSGESAYQIVNKNALAVNQLPDAAVTVTLTLTASIEGKTVTATKTVTITIEKPVVVNYGSVDAPLTVAEAIALANTIDGNDYLGGKDDPIQVVVKGIVIDAGTFSTYSNWQNAYFADTADALKTDKTKAAQIYRLGLDGTFLKTKDDLKVGAEITIQGWLQNFNGTAEVCHNNATSTDCKAVAYKAPEGGEDPTPGPTLSDPVKGTEIATEGATVFDFSGVTVAAENDYNAMTNEAILAEFKGTADLPTAVEGTKVYAGNNNSTSGPADYRSKGGFLRMGSGSAVGTLKLTFAKDINKVQILCLGWATTDKIAIDGFNPAEIGSNTTKVAFTFTLSEAVKSFTITTTNRALIFKIAVTFVDGGSQGGGDTETDQAKVDRALAAVKDTYEVSVTGDYALPTSTVDGVTFAWKVTEGGDKYELTNGNALNIAALPTDADDTVKLTLTATCGSEGTGTKEVTVTVKMAGAEPENKYGTLDAPLTVAQAIALARELPSGKGGAENFTAEPVYMKGYVIEAGEWSYSTQYGGEWKNVYIADSESSATSSADAILVFYLHADDAYLKLSGDLIKGTQIVIYGYVENFAYSSGDSAAGTPEIADYNNVKTKAVAYTVTEQQKADAAVAAVGDLSSASVTEDVELPASTVTGVTFAWTLDDEDGTNAKVEGNKVTVTRTDSDVTVTLTLTATCGAAKATHTYTLKILSSSAAEAEVLYTFSSMTQKGSNNGYANNCDVEVDGVTWNVEGNSTMNPWRFGGKNLSGVDRKLTGKTAISGTVSKIVINFGSCNATVNSITLKVYTGDPTTDDAVAAYTKDVSHKASSSVTVEAGAGEEWKNCYFQLVFNVTVSGKDNKYVTVETMEFWGFADSATVQASAEVAILPGKEF